MKAEDFLPDELVICRPEPPTPGASVDEDLRLEVAIGDILTPGQKIAVLDQTLMPPSGRPMSDLLYVYYEDCYEARVEEVLPTETEGQPMLRLKPIRLMANFICADVTGTWDCEIPDYIHRQIYKEEMIIRPGERIGHQRTFGDQGYSEPIPVIFSGEEPANVLHVFLRKGFVRRGEHLLMYATGD